MKKNTGFTLVELLSVILILGIIMVIVGTAATKTKKDANIKEAQQIEEMLKDLGPGIYTYEKSLGIRDVKSHCEKELNGTYSTNCSVTGSTTYEDFFNYQYKDKQVSLSFEELYNAGYLKEVVIQGGSFKGIKNPAGGVPCTGYININDAVFTVCLNCPGIDGYTDSCSADYDTAELTK